MQYIEKESSLSSLLSEVENPGRLLAKAEGRRMEFAPTRSETDDRQFQFQGVVEGGVFRVTAFSISTISGAPLREDEVPTDMRRFAAFAAAMTVAREAMPWPEPSPQSGTLDEERAAIKQLQASWDLGEKIESEMHKVRRRTDWTPERLKELALVYRDAQAQGAAPRQACAAHFQLAPPTISRAIRLARDAGYLAEPEKDHHDAQA